MVGRPHHSLVASLDDNATGSHRAYYLSNDGTVSWVLNGRFVRSFRADSAGKLPLEAAIGVDHVIFTRFKEEGLGDAGTCAVALCIFRSDQLVIHFYSGDEFGVMLPFGVRAVHSLYTGLLIQSKAARRSADNSLFATELPTFFSLLGPRSEFKMLGLNRSLDLDRMRGQRDSLFILSPAPARSDDLGSSIPVFNDPNAVLVSTAFGRLDTTSQYVLCWDTALRRHAVYQCIVSSRPLDNDDDYSSDTDTSTGTLAGRAAGADRSHLSASRPGLSRQPSMSVQRRSSAAVSAAAMAASRRKSSYGSAVKGDRRNSLLGRVSFNDSPGANYAADIFREQRQTRAEIILHLCWAERRQRGELRISDAMSAQLFVIQSATGSDVVCVFFRDIGQVVGLETSGFTEIFRYSARSAALVHAIRSDIDDLLIVTDSGRVALVFGDGEEPVPLETTPQGQISMIRHIEGTQATLATATEHEDVVVSANVQIPRLVLSALDSLSFVLSVSSYSQFRRCVIASACQTKGPEASLGRLSMLLVRGEDRGSPAAILGARAKKELRDRAAAVLYALHLVFEDAAMHKAEPASQLYDFGQLLAQFAQQHSISRAKQFYACAGFGSGSAVAGKAANNRQRADCDIPSLPLFAQWALSLTSYDTTRLRPFPSLSHIAELFTLNDCKPVRGAQNTLKLLDTVADILFQLRVGCQSPTVLQSLAADREPLQLLLQLTPELQWLIGATMMQSRKVCTFQWPPSVLMLLGRQDLVVNFGCRSAGASLKPGDKQRKLAPAACAQVDDDKHGSPESKSIVELCEEALGLLTKAHIGNNDSRQSTESREFSSVSFGRDLRVEEANRLLQLATTVHTNYLLPSSAATDEAVDSVEGAKALYMDQLACRTLALPLGRGLFDYSARNLDSQGALKILSPKVSARFRGHKADTVWATGSVDTSWPLFHSGVAAALSIERSQAKGVHPSWVLLNWPSELASDTEAGSEADQHKKYRDSLALHAGFLLGMGMLSGHSELDDESQARQAVASRHTGGPLCDIPPWQAFKYLSIRHGLTSIALLLGRACAHRGTMNSSVSKVLSLHIPNLLPPGSSELMLLSYGTQAAAMLGLGLLFMQSQNRRMVEVMLRELLSIKQSPFGNASNSLDSSDVAESTAECYSLASGFALGLVVLGQGLSTQSLADLQLLDTLSETMASGSGTGTGTSSGRGARPANADGSLTGQYGIRNDLSLGAGDRQGLASSGGGISDLGLIAALGLAFLGTDYGPAAQRLALPAVAQQLRTADPFILLWKSLMRFLILLSSVRPTREWVEASMPLPLAAMPGPIPADLCRVRLNVVSAACFAMALKFAGTEDKAAHATTLAYFDEMEAIASKPVLGYEASLTRACAQVCLDILSISAALVMAGSGDVSTMTRLRALHGVSGSRSYGNHVAVHMALGILFIGGGARFTISRSHESIAMLVVALFPRFPQHYTDNVEHLQAWRHIWALCVEPRCLVIRDAATDKICRNATASIARLAHSGMRETETVVPPVSFRLLAGAVSVRLQAPGYLPLELDLMRSAATEQHLLARRVVYLQPSTGILQSAVAGINGHPGMFEQYREWLSDAQHRVVDVTERLSTGDPTKVPDVASVAKAIHSVERMRLCVQFSRHTLAICPNDDSAAAATTLGVTNASEGWAETTYTAWMSVREKVLALARLESSQRIVTTYWTGSQAPSSSNVFHSVVGLLSAALDLPSPAQALELAKHVPIASLVDYVLM
ncbi:Anaphase-promoting complex subunit 1 [Coemansia sp. RSA 2337]|nr:Anaphase-promoting complex subunit 1 [Coemansia sp. S680]KAJ2057260.1 Anaphase-promoting complex subunit 1 [Coemansia sp. S2]KAJ2066586.1 Anaphase-promoting complex subunit 1 [Coemansia sp. S155-1]KAJ2469669.1 Anaphase-promoting complex subunit 1 [Coemansia sp. RSA 2337]